MDHLKNEVYLERSLALLQEHFHDASLMAFNFRERENLSQIDKVFSEYDIPVINYPQNYGDCPVLTMEMIDHFLRSADSWLSVEDKKGVLLMHCERGGWPLVAFMLAALLLYRKQCTGEEETLNMIYGLAPHELLQLVSQLNPLPSQLRYLHYLSNMSSVGGILSLDGIILRCIPCLDALEGFHPIIRIFGEGPFQMRKTPVVLFSTPETSNNIGHYKQVV